MSRRAPTSRRIAVRLAVMFAVGLASGLVMLFRSQTGGDQANLLVGGWVLYTEGWWQPYGNPMSGGGFEPGGLTSLLVGLPLFVSESFRSVNALILLTHVVAYLLLDRVVRDALGPRERLLLALLYWLNPWRAYFSAHLWNPNYLYLVGAVHLWTAWKQRRGGRFRASFLHVFAIGCAFQLHGSFLILAIASGLMWWRRYLRVHWGGAVAGAAVVIASLVPWMRLVAEQPDVLPMHDGFLGRGLVTVYPLAKGFVYWLRYSSLYFSGDMTTFDFTPLLGVAADRVLTPLFTVLTRWLGPVTLPAALAANVWLWRRRATGPLSRRQDDDGEREWIAGYARWCLVAAGVTFALSPTTIMMWQGLIVLHAAVLPTVMWAGTILRTRRGARPARRIALGWGVVTVLGLTALSVAAPMYRKGGRDPVFVVVSRMVPVIERTGIAEHCTVVIDPDAVPPKMPRRREQPEGQAALDAGSPRRYAPVHERGRRTRVL